MLTELSTLKDRFELGVPLFGGQCYIPFLTFTARQASLYARFTYLVSLSLVSIPSSYTRSHQQVRETQNFKWTWRPGSCPFTYSFCFDFLPPLTFLLVLCFRGGYVHFSATILK